MAGRHNPREKGRSAGAQDGAVMCTTAPHPCLISSRNRCMHGRQKVVHNRTHHLRQKKHDTGGKRVVGDVTQKRKDD